MLRETIGLQEVFNAEPISGKPGNKESEKQAEQVTSAADNINKSICETSKEHTKEMVTTGDNSNKSICEINKEQGKHRVNTVQPSTDDTLENCTILNLVTLNTVASKPFYRCKTCKNMFTLKSHFTNHICSNEVRTESELYYLCNVCNRLFQSRSQLEKHHFNQEKLINLNNVMKDARNRMITSSTPENANLVDSNSDSSSKLPLNSIEKNSLAHAPSATSSLWNFPPMQSQKPTFLEPEKSGKKSRDTRINNGKAVKCKNKKVSEEIFAKVMNSYKSACKKPTKEAEKNPFRNTELR